MPVRQLEQFLASHPVAAASDEVQKVLQPRAFNEKEYDRERKAKQRAIGRQLDIPPPKDISFRLACLADPEFLLTECFPSTYYEPFTIDRRDMLQSIWRAARYGGDQAIAGSRGEGKTTLAMDGSLTLMLAGLTFFPVVIGKNQDAASDELKALRDRITASEVFADTFPEIAIPLLAIGASTANARLQTVGGKFIGMFLGIKHFAFPSIPTELLRWPDGVESVARGQVVGAVGIDGRIRGFKYRSHRPTLALIDDIEDKYSANNDDTIAKNEKTIEEDIGGMGSSAERIARVYLCTTLNRKCNAYKYTDRANKKGWNGRRYRKMIKRPDRMDLVQQYIEMRKYRGDDDPDARIAFRFWRDNQTELERGAEVSNKYSHSKKVHADGEPLELSAIQSYFNRVADTSEDAVATEIDNDPPETTGPQGNGLTIEMVLSRNNGLAKCQLPASTVSVTAAIDLGKYSCHWVIIAWFKGGGGCVVDYGVAEVHGTDERMDNEASEPAIYRTLLNWRDELLSKSLVDASGESRKVDVVFVDSGTYTNAAYEFVRQVGAPFYCSKGIGNYRNRAQSTEKCKAGDNMHAQYLESQNIWLFELGTDYWKQWTHERFMSPTFDESNMLRTGALSIYDSGTKKHLSYAKHIVAEELVTEFKEGKGAKTYWHVHNVNNHWLDATYNASAAARWTGVALLTSPGLPKVAPREVKETAAKPKPSVQHGKRFRTRPGGWVNSIRRG
jgi:hypothetical protein